MNIFVDTNNERRETETEAKYSCKFSFSIHIHVTPLNFCVKKNWVFKNQHLALGCVSISVITDAVTTFPSYKDSPLFGKRGDSSRCE